MVLGRTCTTRYFSLDTSRYFLFWPSYDSVRWTTLIFFNHYKNSPIRNLNIVTIHCILMCVLSAFFLLDSVYGKFAMSPRSNFFHVVQWNTISFHQVRVSVCAPFFLEHARELCVIVLIERKGACAPCHLVLKKDAINFIFLFSRQNDKWPLKHIY